MSGAKKRIRRMLLVILVLIIVSATVVALIPEGRSRMLDFVAWLRDAGWAGKAIALAVPLVAIPIGLPTLWFAAVFGYIFGFGLGLSFSLSVIPLAATAAFALSRLAMYDELIAKLRKRRAWAATIDAVAEGGWQLAALLRVAGPHNLLNVLLAASPIRKRDFMIGVYLGSVPSLTLATAGGSLATDLVEIFQAGKAFGPAGVVFLALGAAVLIGCVVYVRRKVKRRLAASAAGAV